MLVLCGAALPAPDTGPVKALRESWRWRVFDRQEGVASGSSSVLHQDRYEYIYVSTEKGLSRYDLWEWTPLSAPEPFDGPVRRFVESFGNLYAATAGTLWKVQGGAALQPMYRGSGLLTASSPQGEVYLIDTGGEKHLQIRGEALTLLDPDVRLPAGEIFDYQIDSSRVHWLAGAEGLFSRDLRRRAWRAVRDRELAPALAGRRCVRFLRMQGPAERAGYPNAHGRSAAWEELWAVFEDPESPGSGSVLAHLQDSRWKVLAEIPGPAVQGVIADAQRNYYATSEDGRLRFSPDGRQWTLVDGLGVGEVAVFAEMADSSGALWFRIGTGGIAAFDPQSLRWESIPIGGSRSFPNVLSVIETEEGDVWMGMTKGLSWFRRGASPESFDRVHGVPLESITGLAEDRQRRIWISSGEAFAGAFCYEESTWTRQTIPGFSDHPIRRIVRDRSGELWFLSEERTESGEYVMYHSSLYTADNILGVTVPHGPINDLVRTGESVDGRDVMWLATDEGLLKGTVDGKTFRLLKRITQENGLRSQRVFAVAEAADGAVWVCYPGSSSGVTRIQGDSSRHMDVRDGLASPEVWSIAALGQNLWFGTDRGLSRFDGECWYNYSVASSDPRTSRVLPVFPSITVPDSVIVGTWGQGALRFRLDDRRRPRRPRFTMLDLPERFAAGADASFSWDARDFRNNTLPAALLFRSRLDGKPWSRFSNDRSRTFSGLTPGRHVFEVEVRDLDGNRNREEVVHAFLVGEPGGGGLAVILAGAGLAVLALAGGILYGPRIAAGRRRRRLARRFLAEYPLVLFLIDAKGKIVDLSGAALKFLDGEFRSRSDAVGKALSSLEPFRDRELRGVLRDLLAGEPAWIEAYRWTPDGAAERTLEVRAFPLAAGPAQGSGRDNPSLAVVLLEDVTERAEAERLRVRTRRLNSLRNFAGRIVDRTEGLLDEGSLHELQKTQPAFSERLRRLQAVSERLAAFAGDASDSARWTATSVNAILEPVVGDHAGSAASPERLRIEGNVRIDYRAQPGIWNVVGEKRALREAILEVLENAVESMPEKGTLTVRTANMRVENDPGPLPPGPYVEIVVRDTGPGMDAAQIEQVFEPFYSTKSRDKALGIGLSTAYGIVRIHGGDLRLESRPGRGTMVRILLPASRAL